MYHMDNELMNEEMEEMNEIQEMMQQEIEMNRRNSNDSKTKDDDHLQRRRK